jgi:hypothetical protein
MFERFPLLGGGSYAGHNIFQYLHSLTHAKMCASTCTIILILSFIVNASLFGLVSIF